jgi:muramoyltetrapeptide carboxypeptidase
MIRVCIFVVLCSVVDQLIMATYGQQPVFKPARIVPGDMVGFVSPASPPYYKYNASTYQGHVISTMKALGLSVKFSANSFVEWGYLAGTDEQRASDFMQMIRDPTVKMIIANRGGWGCDRIVDLILM